MPIVAHDWSTPPNAMWRFTANPRRCCRACGAIQDQVIDQSWGRVTGRHWAPLVGRCPGPPKPAAVRLTPGERRVLRLVADGGGDIYVADATRAGIPRAGSILARLARRRLVDLGDERNAMGPNHRLSARGRAAWAAIVADGIG